MAALAFHGARKTRRRRVRRRITGTERSNASPINRAGGRRESASLLASLCDWQIAWRRTFEDAGDGVRYCAVQLRLVRAVSDQAAGLRHFGPFAGSWQARLDRKPGAAGIRQIVRHEHDATYRAASCRTSASGFLS